jgi:hypothetical protein
VLKERLHDYDLQGLFLSLSLESNGAIALFSVMDDDNSSWVDISEFARGRDFRARRRAGAEQPRGRAARAEVHRAAAARPPADAQVGFPHGRSKCGLFTTWVGTMLTRSGCILLTLSATALHTLGYLTRKVKSLADFVRAPVSGEHDFVHRWVHFATTHKWIANRRHAGPLDLARRGEDIRRRGTVQAGYLKYAFAIRSRRHTCAIIFS